MAATTTMKLPENLKKRIAPLAESAGKTPHEWMIEALDVQASLAEKRIAFIADALASQKEVERAGKVYRFEDVHRYIHARVQGKRIKRPKPVNW